MPTAKAAKDRLQAAKDRLVEETTVDNKRVQLLHVDVPIEKIQLDEDNPRIKYRLALQLGNGKRPTEKDLEKAILDIPEVKQLRRDIERNGGLRERIILQDNGSGKLKAIEGNCRLTCIRDLHAKDKTDIRWKTVPARILPKDVKPKDVAILLTDFHVAGKIRWEPHEKAGQIYYMANDLGMPQDEIAVYMHASKSTVNRYLQAYSFMVDRFLQIDEGAYADEGRRKWSYFDEFFKKKDLKEELAKNPEFGDEFCRWVGDGRLPKGEDVRTLPTILKHETAREAFENGTPLEQVREIIREDVPEEGSEFFKLLGKVREACTSSAHIREIIRIRRDAKAKQRLLQTYEAMTDFMRLADVELPNTD